MNPDKIAFVPREGELRIKEFQRTGMGVSAGRQKSSKTEKYRDENEYPLSYSENP